MATTDRGMPPTRTAELDWRSAVVAAAALLALGAVAAFVASAPRTVTYAVIAGLLTLALSPVVGVVERRARVRRSVAVALVVAGITAAAAVLVLVLGPPAVRQAQDFGDELPQVIDDLGELPIIGTTLEQNDVPARIEEFVETLPARLAGDTAPIEGVARSALGGAIAGVATLLLLVALLLDGERLVHGVRRLVPVRHRDRADQVGDLFYRVVGKYFAGSLLVALIAGVVTLVVGLLLGIPLTPLLAVNVAVFDLVPQIGGAAGGIPFVLLAFLESPTTGVIAGVFFVLYLQFENNVLQPVVVGEAVDLSPVATMVGALVGVSIAGVPGALVAIPFIGAAKALYLAYRPAPIAFEDPAVPR